MRRLEFNIAILNSLTNLINKSGKANLISINLYFNFKKLIATLSTQVFV